MRERLLWAVDHPNQGLAVLGALTLPSPARLPSASLFSTPTMRKPLIHPLGRSLRLREGTRTGAWGLSYSVANRPELDPKVSAPPLVAPASSPPRTKAITSPAGPDQYYLVAGSKWVILH